MIHQLKNILVGLKYYLSFGGYIYTFNVKDNVFQLISHYLKIKVEKRLKVKKSEFSPKKLK